MKNYNAAKKTTHGSCSPFLIRLLTSHEDNFVPNIILEPWSQSQSAKLNSCKYYLIDSILIMMDKRTTAASTDHDDVTIANATYSTYQMQFVSRLHLQK